MIDHKNIHMALAAAQAVMGKAAKGAENPAFKRDGTALRYADLASVMDACMPALSANGISVMQPTGHDDGGHYCRTVLTHGASETSVECRVPLFGVTAPQPYGSAVTYARRYGLMCMAGIAPDDEDDGNAAQGAAKNDPPPNQPAFITPAQIDTIIDLAFRADVTEAKICAAFKVPGFDKISAADFDAVVKKLNATIAAKKPVQNDLGGDEIPY